MIPLSAENAQIATFYATFRRDVAVFEERLPELLKEFPGQYVAIVNGEIIGHDAKWETLADTTKQRFPNMFVFLERVVARTTDAVDMDTLEG